MLSAEVLSELSSALCSLGRSPPCAAPNVHLGVGAIIPSNHVRPTLARLRDERLHGRICYLDSLRLSHTVITLFSTVLGEQRHYYYAQVHQGPGHVSARSRLPRTCCISQVEMSNRCGNHVAFPSDGIFAYISQKRVLVPFHGLPSISAIGRLPMMIEFPARTHQP